MRILLLGRQAETLQGIDSGDTWLHEEDEMTADEVASLDPDLVVSFGYRYIITRDILSAVEGRALNLHISLLPWNRGADPNLWSWLENTPKGISVHWIDEGIDTGPLVGQERMVLDSSASLRQTYEDLVNGLTQLFTDYWPTIRAGKAPSVQQLGAGSFHRSKDKESFLECLTDGWDTPCKEVLEYGRSRGLWLIP